MFDEAIALERNSCIFEDIERSKAQLESLLICTMYDWSCAWGHTICNSLQDFTESLNFCARFFFFFFKFFFIIVCSSL